MSVNWVDCGKLCAKVTLIFCLDTLIPSCWKPREGYNTARAVTVIFINYHAHSKHQFIRKKADS